MSATPPRQPRRREGGSPKRSSQRTGAPGRPNRSAQRPAERARHSDAARTAAFDALAEVRERDAYANLVLPPLLTARKLTGRDAGFVTELVYGTLRLRGRYDAILAACSSRPLGEIDGAVLDILRLGAHQLLAMRVPPHAAVSETVALARSRAGAGPAQFVNAVLRSVSRKSLSEWLTEIADGEGVDQLAVRESHPAWVVRALREALVGHGRAASEINDLLAAHNEAPRVTLVARPGLTDRENLAADLAKRGIESEPGRLSPVALAVRTVEPGSIPQVRSAQAGVQDEGSQVVALALTRAAAIQPGQRWLDLCAGPGGKAALLAAVLGESNGELTAVELQEHRAKLVEQAVAPSSKIVTVRVADGRQIGGEEPETYDRVLVDAPCTGLGALRRRPEARWRRRPEDLPQLGVLQRELLASAIAAAKPGGLIAYVTCSPHLAETLFVVEDTLRRHPNVEQLDARPAVADVVTSARAALGEQPVTAAEFGAGPAVQLWPHIHGTDAMFLALLRRR